MWKESKEIKRMRSREDRMKKYLIYVDILGFEKLAEEIAEISGFEEDDIRQKYLRDPLRKEIDKIKKFIPVSEGISEIEGSDNYILILDNIQITFEIIGKLTRIKIPHRAYGCIPLELCFDVKEIDEKIQVDSINRKEIIKFLKKDIIKLYRKYYKSKYGESIKESFLVFTQEFFEKLEPLDKKYCDSISYKNKTFFTIDVEKIQQRCRIFEFLKKIKQPYSKYYDRINELYIPPKEYDEIKEKLKTNRIVFITGTKEYGKTYTAVRLLWEYFIKGYEPRWLEGRESRGREKVRKALEEIENELKPKHIIYFEDPFGKTGYEGTDSLERRIGTIIECIKNVDDVYVILTSREEVSKEFEQAISSSKCLKNLEIKVNMKKISYNYEKRREILLSWAEAKDCKWYTDDSLKKFVLKALKNEKNLPTVLSIRDFVIATANIMDKDTLKEKIKEKSEETAKAFAEEIKNMSEDKILFLSFPFISDDFDIFFIKSEYRELVKELSIKNAWEFDRILDWFKEDKIDIRNEFFSKYLGKYFANTSDSETLDLEEIRSTILNNYLDKSKPLDKISEPYQKIFEMSKIQFSHPSYSEALKYILVENGYFTRINKEIFSRVLLKLAEKERAAGSVASTVEKNFNDLLDDVKNKLLYTLSEKEGLYSEYENIETKEDVKGTVAETIANNFNKLPEDLRNELLFKLSEGDEEATATWYVARALMENFDKIPENLRNLLFTLSEKDETAWCVAHGLEMANFDKISEDIRNELLFTLSEKDDTARGIARVLMRNYEKIPEDLRNLLFTLSEKDDTARDVGRALEMVNFDKLPENVRNKLLFTLSKKDVAIRYVSYITIDNFDKLPEDLRNKLLFIFSENIDSKCVFVEFVLENFDKVPKKIRNLLDNMEDCLNCTIERMADDNPLKTIEIISKTRSKINKKFALKILKKLSNHENEEVRGRASKLMEALKEK